MDRRDFIKISGGALAGALLYGCNKPAAEDDSILKASTSDSFKDFSEPERPAYFSLTQMTSATNKIGNSYVLVTGNGKVIVMDGGLPTDEVRLRTKLRSVGNHVDAWFISHPHGDHVGALIPILENREGITLGTISHSRLNAALLAQETGARNSFATPFYNALARQTETKVVDVQETGQIYTIDGVKIKVLGIANIDIYDNAFNNSSMILKVWDDTKSVLFLGDAGVECGKKVLAAFPKDLDCDYIQMAHHGQQGCDETFYKTVNFRACLWPTPSWLWAATESSSYKTWETRRWVAEKGVTENHVACLEADWTLK
ncbi:MAG: MBL fold metallo-hydrolase [Bacteroidales bacterium]|nr:MBL fold metallo-hydrolase [Bacteroidales bacterium]